MILTALAAVLAFVPLTQSVFWGSMAYTLIGGTAVGTVLILLFLPALYAAWFRIKPTAVEIDRIADGRFVLKNGNEPWRGPAPLTSAVKRLVTKISNGA